jgi:hypothetical protein
MAATSMLLYDPQHADSEIITAAGFLAGYSGRTREAYSLDLRQFIAWCHSQARRLRGPADPHRAVRPRA